MSDNSYNINEIETALKNNNVATLSNNQLLFYLYYNSKNQNIKPSSKAEEYLQTIKNSFCYENIFVNKNNYSSIIVSIVALLIPFYYYFPRFYNVGVLAVVIGVMGFFSLGSIINNLYSNFFKYFYFIYFALTVIIYVLFFMVLNQLHHITLFFISSIISFLLINYIGKIILTIPSDNNKYNKFSATEKGSSNQEKFTQYNQYIETVAIEVNKRYNLGLPSGNMLYSYLTIFDITPQTKNNQILNFIVMLIGPVLSIGILVMLGSLFSQFKIEGLNNENNSFKNLLPVIGINEESDKYYSCQANYILPTELNVHLLINEFIEKYKNVYKTETIDKITKALRRISNELLERYRPIFNNMDSKEIIQTFLERYNISTNKKINTIDNLREVINDKYADKQEEKFNMLKELDEIRNSLYINSSDHTKFNDTSLARDVLKYNLNNLETEEKENIRDIVDEFYEKFVSNLDGQNGLLSGYNYNLITFNILPSYVKESGNKILKYILSLISTWFLIGKTIASPFFIGYMTVNSKPGWGNIKNIIKNEGFFWKFISMGLDLSYFEKIGDVINNDKESENNNDESNNNGENNNENSNRSSFITSLGNTFYYLLAFIFLMPVLGYCNSAIFGLSLSPLYNNLIVFVVVGINILINILRIKDNQALLSFNVGYILIIIFIFIIIQIIMNYMKK